jgi:hypothetical protein
MIGQVIEVIRQKSSRNGNPKYTAIIRSNDGVIDTVTTATDSSHGYGMTNHTGQWIHYTTRMLRNVLTFVELESAPKTAQADYVNAEFESLPDSDTYRLRVQVDGVQTKFLNVNRSQLRIIRDLLANT